MQVPVVQAEAVVLRQEAVGALVVQAPVVQAEAVGLRQEAVGALVVQAPVVQAEAVVLRQEAVGALVVLEVGDLLEEVFRSLHLIQTAVTRWTSIC